MKIAGIIAKVCFVGLVTILIILAFMASSCQKEKTTVSQTNQASPLTMLDQNAGDEYSLVTDNSKSSVILHATTSTQIPSQFFKVDPKYKTAYVHIKQYTNECSWTSYTLCAGAIAKGKGNTYDVDHTKITFVKNWCNGYSYIERLRDFANQMDNWFLGNVYLSKESKTATGRFTTIKQMLNHINDYKMPFIAIITAGGIGHYVVVWSVDWKCGGAGSTVYYTDPLDYPASTFDGQIKTMGFTAFLDKMGPLNPATNNYCALFLR